MNVSVCVCVCVCVCACVRKHISKEIKTRTNAANRRIVDGGGPALLAKENFLNAMLCRLSVSFLFRPARTAIVLFNPEAEHKVLSPLSCVFVSHLYLLCVQLL